MIIKPGWRIVQTPDVTLLKLSQGGDLVTALIGAVLAVLCLLQLGLLQYYLWEPDVFAFQEMLKGNGIRDAIIFFGSQELLLSLVFLKLLVALALIGHRRAIVFSKANREITKTFSLLSYIVWRTTFNLDDVRRVLLVDARVMKVRFRSQKIGLECKDNRTHFLVWTNRSRGRQFAKVIAAFLEVPGP